MASSSQSFADVVIDNMKSTYNSASEGFTWHAVLTYGAIFLVSWFLYKAFLEHLVSPLRTLPSTKFNPFLGNMRELVKGEAMEATIKIMKEVGVVCRYFFLFGRERVLVCDPDVIKHITVTNSKNYMKPPSRLKLMKMMLGDGLVTLEGSSHAAHKRLMSPFFNNNAVKRAVPVIIERSQKLSDHWLKQIRTSGGNDKKTVELEIQNDLSKTTLDIVGIIAFGHNFNSIDQPDMPVNMAFQRILSGEGFNWRFAMPYYHSLSFMPDVKQFKADCKLMHDEVAEVIENKKALLAKGVGEDDVTSDVLGQMLLAKDEEGKGLSTEELRSEVMTLMSAGHETTSNGVAWTLLLLAQNPVVQERAREEILRVLPEKTADISWDSLDELKYLGCIIKESLRLLPPVPMTLRQAIEADYIPTPDNGRQYIPAGTILNLAIGPMMRRQDLFDSPSEFLPERFLDSELEKKFYNYLPFLVGHRMCIGFRFALLEMRAMLALCIRDMHFETIPGAHFKRQSRITMRPSPALKLMVKTVK